jgi:hypothetical protein
VSPAELGWSTGQRVVALRSGAEARASRRGKRSCQVGPWRQRAREARACGPERGWNGRRGLRESGTDKRGPGCQRRGEGRASADGVGCGTGRRSLVSKRSGWLAGPGWCERETLGRGAERGLGRRAGRGGHGSRRGVGCRSGLRRREGRGGRAIAGLGCFLGWVLGLGFLSFLFLSSFSNKLKPHSNLIEFKPNLNSNPMHSTK